MTAAARLDRRLQSISSRFLTTMIQYKASIRNGNACELGFGPTRPHAQLGEGPPTVGRVRTGPAKVKKLVGLSYCIRSCTLYTCDHGIPNTSLYTCMLICECNVNHHHCSMHIPTYSRRCPCTHTCGNYIHNHSTLVRIRYAHTTCQIIVTTFLRQDGAVRTERNVLETITE